MALPTQEEVLTGEYVLYGSWARVVPRSDVDIDTLEYFSDNGAWWGIEPTQTVTITKVGTVLWTAVSKVGTVLKANVVKIGTVSV